MIFDPAFNLWDDSDNCVGAVIKVDGSWVYDPCPAGEDSYMTAKEMAVVALKIQEMNKAQ